MTDRDADAALSQLLTQLECAFATDKERAANAERVFVSLMKAAIPIQLDEAHILSSKPGQLQLSKD